MTDIVGLPAALRLCENLIRQFDAADAQTFAAFVLAKLTLDTNLSTADAIRKLMSLWTQLTMELPGPVEFVNCSCGLPCTGQADATGRLTITHHSAACQEFKSRFTQPDRVVARDHTGWDNLPSNTTRVGTGQDDSEVRFKMMEMT